MYIPALNNMHKTTTTKPLSIRLPAVNCQAFTFLHFINLYKDAEKHILMYTIFDISMGINAIDRNSEGEISNRDLIKEIRIYRSL